MRVLTEHARNRIQPVLFVGIDAPLSNIEPFGAISGVEVVRSAEFDDERKSQRLRDALITGCDRAAAQSLRKHRIDVLFESAQFCGWRFPVPSIAWLPDFQHRHLRELFTFGAYWKRDLGFRAQILSGRHIMLSSEDSRRDCERFFPKSIGRTSVVRFAVLPPDASDFEGLRPIVNNYNLPEQYFYLPNQFWKHKNHRIVIEALHVLRQKGIDLVVAASGKPEDYRHPHHYETLQSLVGSLGLKENFRFLGIVPRQHVFALMRACTAMINPSLSEGWSSTVEEAKSLGVPMLLSNLSVHQEQAGDSALFFDPHEAERLAALMSQQKNLPASSRHEMEKLASTASRKRVSQFAADFSYTVERALA
ncbi:glycosyltransferase family 4 protein [Alloacidobacterium dinghuense]|uniref:Glycosyltransferase family 4 protein n=1 Tax=Alloacidobacterium dinghuense TaxID=2763107 RepID=A0A7G8BE04_9BACT|nr:glycosyltransferase family 1 protein [Alloacidobacterium dinghuense]QNI30774.1 glycosyltransferase family 4 protein [Alloacidobacterium dinghuense]